MKIGQTSFIYFISQVLTSLIGFLAILYFARVIGAGPLDTYFLILAVIAWLKLFGTMGTKSAVAKRVSEGGEGVQFFLAATVIQLVVVSLISAGLYVFRDPLADYVGGGFLWLILGMFVGMSFFLFFKGVLRGQDLVHVEGVLSPTEKLLRSTLQIVLVFAGYSVVGLLVGYVAGVFIALALAFVIVLVKFRAGPHDLSPPSLKHFKSIFSYGKYSWLTGVTGRTFSSMDLIILGLFIPSGSGAVAIYAVAWRIASLFSIFSNALQASLFPHISRRSAEGVEVGEHINNALAFTGLFVIPGLVGGFLVGDRVLLLYAEEFVRGAGVLVVLILARLIYSYQLQLVWALNAVDMPDVTFRINAAFVVVNLFLNVVLIYFYGMIGAATATMLSAVVAVLMGYRAISDVVEFELPYAEIGRQWLSAITMGVAVVGTLRFFEATGIGGNLTITVVSVTIGVFVYIAALATVSDRFRSAVINNVPFDLPGIVT